MVHFMSVRIGATDGYVTVPWGDDKRHPSVLVDSETLAIAVGVKEATPYIRAVALAKLGKARIGTLFPIDMRRHAHNLRRVGEHIPATMAKDGIGIRRLVAAAGKMAKGKTDIARAILSGMPYGKDNHNA